MGGPRGHDDSWTVGGVLGGIGGTSSGGAGEGDALGSRRLAGVGEGLFSGVCRGGDSRTWDRPSPSSWSEF